MQGTVGGMSRPCRLSTTASAQPPGDDYDDRYILSVLSGVENLVT